MSKESIRAFFPIFRNDERLVYLDNAATTQKPEAVIRKLEQCYCLENANIHRGNYPLSLKASEAYQQSKESVCQWIDAASSEEIAYDREAFVNDVGTVRITFDKALTAMEPRQDLFDPQAPGYHVLPPGQMILEVKFTGILPEYIQSIFRAYSFVRTSASKFCLCADQVRHTLR